MQTTYLRYLNFHSPTDDDMKQIRKMQSKRRIQTFLKRFMIILLIFVAIGVSQTLARQTAPHRFSAANTVEVLYRRLTYGFVVANIISYLQLLFMSYVYFQRSTAEVIRVKLNHKLKKKWLMLFTITTREIFCECINPEEDIIDEHKLDIIKDVVFIKDGIYVDGPFEFSNLRKGDYIYIERFEDDGNYIYHLVA